MTLDDRDGAGRTVQANVNVGTTGSSRLVTQADVCDENTLEIAGVDGALLKFPDPVVIRGGTRPNVAQGTSGCSIDVSEISRASAP